MYKFRTCPQVPYSAGGGAYALSSEEIGVKDEQGRPHGWWKLYKRGEIHSEYLHSHGEVQQIRKYDYGVLSAVTLLRKNGNKTLIKVSSIGVPRISEELTKEDVCIEYKEYSPVGQVLLSVPFKKGKLHGTVKFYYPNGQLRETCRYIRGRLFGHLRGYYENGNLHYTIEHKKGLPKGWCHSFAEDGKELAAFLWTSGGTTRDRGSGMDRANLMGFRKNPMCLELESHLALKADLAHKIIGFSTFTARLEIARYHNMPIEEVPPCV